MSENINDDILDLHQDKTIELRYTRGSEDHVHTLLKEDSPEEEIDQLYGISYSNSDLFIESQTVHAVNHSSLDELPIPNWCTEVKWERESSQEVEAPEL